MRLSRLAWLGLFSLLGGCFGGALEPYDQTAMPSPPAGAVAVSPGPPAEVFPLTVGSRYDYDAHFGLGGSPFTGDARVSVLAAWRTGSREVEQVAVVSRYFGRTRRDNYQFVRDPDWLGLFEREPPDRITFFMPTRLAVGQRWPVATGEGTGEAVVEAREDVAVKAGRFPGCYRVHYTNAAVQTDLRLWLAPRVGLVKIEVAMQVSLLPLRGMLELADIRPGLTGAEGPGKDTP